MDSVQPLPPVQSWQLLQTADLRQWPAAGCTRGWRLLGQEVGRHLRMGFLGGKGRPPSLLFHTNTPVSPPPLYTSELDHQQSPEIKSEERPKKEEKTPFHTLCLRKEGPTDTQSVFLTTADFLSLPMFTLCLASPPRLHLGPSTLIQTTFPEESVLW
ncbi:hypothetical protein mRhiFer1_008226 [Rhinolophus ferrumequinum]|uniref:Uncharacterized protein n=1 Tax=Rhinolophus ferrumequinum TaxID=59479 RepID=A0A7J7W856_RHIFE|nr:hypothetical protein mRhiFer1_008226 [Rhinolophus ferrumequinum]